MAVLFITHDFGVVADIADRVIVMQTGRVVESGTAREVLLNPQHAYTRALIDAIPKFDTGTERTGESDAPLLEVAGLSKTFRTGGGLFSTARVVDAVKDVSLTLEQGETLGIVGESGSGKSTAGRCIVRLIEPDAGTIHLGGVDIASLSGDDLRQHRRRIQMIFQDPYSSLNPRARVGRILTEGPVAYGTPKAQARARAVELLQLVDLDASAIDRYPHEFSGGQRQRIGIARALALDPQVLIADEAVSALDVSVQAQVLDLLDDLKQRLNLAMIFITHDLRVAAQVCDRIMVMQKGEAVEYGTATSVFTDPQSAYTRSLLDAIPGRAMEAAMVDAMERRQ